METRNVQLSGGSTYTISLPKEWATEHGIDDGSVLFLYPRDDGTLQITHEHSEDGDEWTAVIQVDHLSPERAQFRLLAMHAVGFNEIIVRDASGIDRETRSAISEVTAWLTGLEILDTDAHSLTVRNLIGAENIDIRKSALRLRLVTLSMHQDAMSALLENDTDLAGQVVERDQEADKLYTLLLRSFRRSLTELQEVERYGHSRQSLFEYYYVGRQFERVADLAERIAALTVDHQASVPEQFADDIADVAVRARSVVDRGSEVLLGTADITTAYEVLDDQDAVLADIETLHRELYEHDDAGEAHLIGRLCDLLRRTAEDGGNVARMMIQRTGRQEAFADGGQ